MSFKNKKFTKFILKTIQRPDRPPRVVIGIKWFQKCEQLLYG